MKFGKGSHLSATDVIRILLMGPKQGLVPTPNYCAIFFWESRRALLPVSYLIYSLERHLDIQCNVSVLSSLQGQTVFKSSYGHLTSRGCFTFVQTLRILRMWVKSLRYLLHNHILCSPLTTILKVGIALVILFLLAVDGNSPAYHFNNHEYNILQ